VPVSEQNIHSLFGNRERKALTRSTRLSESGGRRSDDEFFKLSAFPLIKPWLDMQDVPFEVGPLDRYSFTDT
jgi:hypothetical protein